MIIAAIIMYLIGIPIGYWGIVAINNMININFPKWLCIFSLFIIIYILIKYTKL
jgi:hypothetical protein